MLNSIRQMQNCEKNVDEKLLSPVELSKNKVATLYTGPMASGKTTAVITEIQKWGEQHAIVMIPQWDTRSKASDGKPQLRTHDGKTANVKTIRINKLEDVEIPMEKLIIIEEAFKYLPVNLIKLITTLRTHEKTILLTGLQRNLRGEEMKYLEPLEKADVKIIILETSCEENVIEDGKIRRCGKITHADCLRQAYLENTSQINLVGGKEKYISLCKAHLKAHVTKNEEKIPKNA